MLKRRKTEPITGPFGVKQTTQIRVLLFDPDPDGRQQIRSIFKRDAPDVRLTLRARQESFIQSLSQKQYDAVILGLPAYDNTLQEHLLALASAQGILPMIFLVEDGIPTDTSKIIHRYSKGEKGVATLATQLQGRKVSQPSLPSFHT
jgi:hypothetical protein